MDDLTQFGPDPQQTSQDIWDAQNRLNSPASVRFTEAELTQGLTHVIYEGSAQEKSGGDVGGVEGGTEKKPSQDEVSAKPWLSLILWGARGCKLYL